MKIFQSLFSRGQRSVCNWSAISGISRLRNPLTTTLEASLPLSAVRRNSKRPFFFSKHLHTSFTHKAFGIHDVADALSQHPAIIAVTGGSSLGIAAGLYRSPALWKLIARASADQSVLILPQKPSHAFQQRKHEVKKIEHVLKSLRKQNGKDVVVAMYITGRPGYGKTQLAREFGKEYFRKKKGFIFRKMFVGTLNATSKSSFLQSYITLALDLGCTSELKSLESLSGQKGEFQGLELLSAAVRKELKKRPGWLLIVDNLSSDMSTRESGYNRSAVSHPTSEVLPAVSPATVPHTYPGISREAGGSNMAVAAAYGVSNQSPAWQSFWPQAGDEGWGSGSVVVTTHDRQLAEKSSPFTAELYLNDGMSHSDAVALLQRVSDFKESEGAFEVVSALDYAPLSIASAGFYINAERSRNPGYNFHDYLQGLESGIQSESEKMLLGHNPSFPVTMTMALSMATEQLASDPILHKVFVLLAVCAESPVPMRLVARALGVRADINSAALESVRNCALMVFPRTLNQYLTAKGSGGEKGVGPLLDEIESVMVYSGTRQVFRDLLLGQEAVKTDVSGTSVPSKFREGVFPSDLLRHYVDCLVKEYETASASDSVSSYRLRHLLLPHLEAHLQACESVEGFHLDPAREVELCYSLGKGYLLAGRPHKARAALERALSICESNGGRNSIQAANLAATLGNTYRHLALQKESEFLLREALSIYEQKCGAVSLQVAETLYSLSSTCKHRGHYQESRKCLERALEIYEALYDSKHPSVALALTKLGATLRSLGESLRSKELFEKALAIQEELHEPDHPVMAATLSNLSVSYSDIGQPQESIKLLQRALEINRRVHGPDHNSVAITLSNLSIVYRHLGQVRKSKELAKEALEKTEAVHGPAHPGVAIVLGILGSTYSDLGELSEARRLLENSVEINKASNGPQHVGTSIAQTQLGRVTRLAGDLPKARDILETALHTKEAVYGEDHPGIGATLNSLGKVYHELGLLSQSMHALKRAHKITVKHYSSSSNHPQIAFTEADIARVIRDCGKLEDSEKMLQHAIDLYTLAYEQSGSTGYTKTHPKYASMLAIRGLVLRDLDFPKEAKKSLEKALNIQKEILSEQNLMKAETICNLGTVFHRLGERQRALDSFNTALSMMKTVQYQHPITATILAATGRLLVDMKDLKSAEFSLEEALKIRTLCCGSVHPVVATYHKWLAEVLQVENTEKSLEHIQTSLRIFKTLFERERTASVKYGIELPVLQRWEVNMQELENQNRKLCP